MVFIRGRHSSVCSHCNRDMRLMKVSNIFVVILFISTDGFDRGFEANEFQFSYQAYIEVYNKSLDSRYMLLRQCNGALLNNYWVLTTCKCVEEGTSFIITLGHLRPLDYTGYDGHVGVTYLLPRNYPYANSIEDCVSLLEMEIGIKKFNASIGPVLMPNISDDSDLTGQPLFATRYGDELGIVLQYLQIKPRPTSECGGHFPESQICGKSEDPNGYPFGALCNDIGVPLVSGAENVLLGMLSDFRYSTNCKKGGPFLFNRMNRRMVNWINETASKKSYKAKQNEFPYQAFIKVYNVSFDESRNGDVGIIRRCNGAVSQ